MIDINKFKTFTLCENSVADLGFMGEWGFSVLIDFDGIKILFDTGTGLSVVHNTELFDIDLSTIDKIVLSHGHKDHAAGLIPVLKKIRSREPKKEIEIISHPALFDSKYFQRSADEEPFYQGVPFKIEEIKSLGGRFFFSEGPVWLGGDVATSGEVTMVNDYEIVDRGCLLRRETGFIKDPLNDDLALFLKTTLGLVIVVGCAHRGLINTIYHAQNVTGMDAVYMVVGGTHLAHSSEVQILSTIAELKKLGVKKLGASHCTGVTSACRLASELQSAFFYNNAGSAITFSENQMHIKAF